MECQELRHQLTTQGEPDDVCPLDAEVVEESHGVERHLPAVRFWIVRLRALPVAAHVECDYPIITREVLEDAASLPLLETRFETVDEDDGRAPSVHDISDSNAVCIEVLILRRERWGQH